jgi:NAD(P)H dehydrogenase (quinone)
MTSPSIAVTGATGGLGGRVAARLAERGAPQRLVVRDPDRAPRLDRAEVVAAPGGYADGPGLMAALSGAEILFLVSAAEAVDRVSQHLTAVAAAAAAGIRRVVYTSFLGASPDATFTLARHHAATEEAIRASGMGFTFLRSSLYLDFLPLLTGPDGVIRGPAGNGRVATVARDDIADVAVQALLDDEHEGQTYDLTGPEAQSLSELAAVVARVTGHEVSYVPESVEEAYASRAHYGAPDWEVEGWVTTYTAIAAGELDVVSDAVARITGHAPSAVADWLAAHPESYRHLGRAEDVAQ